MNNPMKSLLLALLFVAVGSSWLTSCSRARNEAESAILAGTIFPKTLGEKKWGRPTILKADEIQKAKEWLFENGEGEAQALPQLALGRGSASVMLEVDEMTLRIAGELRPDGSMLVDVMGSDWKEKLAAEIPRGGGLVFYEGDKGLLLCPWLYRK
jgi:hypothetical protein